MPMNDFTNKNPDRIHNNLRGSIAVPGGWLYPDDCSKTQQEKKPGEVDLALSRMELEINCLTNELCSLEETLHPIMAGRPSTDQSGEKEEACPVSVPVALRILTAARTIQRLIYLVIDLREKVSI